MGAQPPQHAQPCCPRCSDTSPWDLVCPQPRPQSHPQSTARGPALHGSAPRLCPFPPPPPLAPLGNVCPSVTPWDLWATSDPRGPITHPSSGIQSLPPWGCS